jgi:pantetheine-phosphate adenylyltransferase
MRDCIYPGSFDPVTKGHKDIIERAAAISGRMYVAVLQNSAKRYMYDLETRTLMLRRITERMRNVEVVTSEGLLTDLMKRLGTLTIIRGLRGDDDLGYERQIAAANAGLLAGVETVMLLSRPELLYVSSSIVKELVAYGADVSRYVPEEVLDLICERKTI